jgi:uncharacterized short protein YbdD (DUF466 family)
MAQEGKAMKLVGSTITRAAQAAWWWLRQVLGDAAYDNYLRSLGRRHTGGREGHAGVSLHPMSREQFYLDALRRRYSGVSRCC